MKAVKPILPSKLLDMMCSVEDVAQQVFISPLWPDNIISYNGLPLHDRLQLIYKKLDLHNLELLELPPVGEGDYSDEE
jgi:hypothetical protein